MCFLKSTVSIKTKIVLHYFQISELYVIPIIVNMNELQKNNQLTLIIIRVEYTLTLTHTRTSASTIHHHWRPLGDQSGALSPWKNNMNLKFNKY